MKKMKALVFLGVLFLTFVAFGFLLAGCGSYAYEQEYGHYISSHHNSTSVAYDDRGVVNRSAQSNSSWSDGYNSYSNTTSYTYNRSYDRYNGYSGYRDWSVTPDCGSAYHRNWNETGDRHYNVYGERIRYKDDPAPTQSANNNGRRWSNKQSNASQEQINNTVYGNTYASNNVENGNSVNKTVIKKTNSRDKKPEGAVGDTQKTETKTRREAVQKHNQNVETSNQSTAAKKNEDDKKKDQTNKSGSSDQRSRIRNHQ